jgi:uncharacterized protein (DUF1697 family)
MNRMALVVLLKGINVGGHRRFRPSVLAQQLKHLDVVNLGAAGTFVVRRTVRPAALREEISRRLPFVAEVMICKGEDILRLTSADPFATVSSEPNTVRFVSVLAKRKPAMPEVPLNLPPQGRWCLRVLGTHGCFVCGVYRREMRAIGYLGQLEKIFGVPVTTRNWNTILAVEKLLNRGRRARFGRSAPFFGSA